MERGRRELMAAMLATSVAGGNTAAGGREDDAEIRDALLGIRDEIRWLRAGCPAPCSEIEQVRTAQNSHLRATGKYPDYLEVGSGLWDAVHDWLFKHSQSPEMTRQRDGRYTMRFGFTSLVLRPDSAAGFIGPPTDAR